MIKKNTMKQSKVSLFLSAFILSLAGCTSVPDQPVDMNNALDKAIANTEKSKKVKPLSTVPVDVQRELMQQSFNQAKDTLLAEKRLDIAAVDVAAKDLFAAIVEDSAYSVAIHNDVSGNISLNLKDVTVDEAIGIVEDLYGFEITRQGNVIQVLPAGMRTETIPLNYLFIKRFGSSSTSINSGGVSENDPNANSNNSSGNNNNNNNSNNNNNGSNGSNNQSLTSGINIYTENESDFWKELKETLETLVGTDGGRSVIVSPQAGLVTIKALPGEIKAVKKFIDDTQNHLRRQVIIEAKIMEVTLNDDYQQGVRWDEVISHVGSTDFTFSTAGKIAGNSISSALGGTTGISFVNADFSGVINLLQTQGNVQVLSSPRITASNNQKAVIKVGQDEYFVTEVSSTTTTGTATTTTPEVTLTPFFSGIALDVTPQIAPDGEVILHVHPSVTTTSEQNKVFSVGDQDFNLPLAQSSVRESDTIVKAQSGEIVVIGGLIETRKTDQESKTPLLGDIPIFGELFKSKAKATQKKELVIMLKPVVAGHNTWNEQLKEARDLLKQWFPESK